MRTPSLGPSRRTPRGFEYIEFKDHYDEDCSLQQSSIAEYMEPGSSAVWLGRENSHMHLNRKQVKALAKHLNHWLRHNTFQ
jgi:hypothetical protein